MAIDSRAALVREPLILERALPLTGISWNQAQAAAGVADDTGNVHTPPMTLKNAALLALIGTILTTVLLVLTLISNVLNSLRGLVPAVTLLSSFIYALACFSVAVFFYVFHREQS